MKHQILDASAHKGVSYSRILQLCRQRRPECAPFITVTFNLDSPDRGSKPPEFGELSVSPVQNLAQYSKFDLHLNITEVAHGFDIALQFDTSLYAEREATWLLSMYEALLRKVIADPAAQVATFNGTSGNEGHQSGDHAGHSEPGAISRSVKATRETVTEIWREVLGSEKVDLHDNFLQLGGDSLSAMRLLLRLKKRLDIELDLDTIFRFPTIQELVEFIENAEPQMVTAKTLR
jgi:acyl carrier protein